MKVQKNAAVALFVALGLKNADKWNDQRLAAKLGKIKEMVDEDVKLEEDAGELLKAVMAAADAGEEFEIEADVAETDAPAEQAEGDPKVEKAAKPKKEKQPKEPKQPKPEPEPGEDRSFPRKIKMGNPGNHEWGSQVMTEYGFPDTITAEMCDRFNELRGRGTRSGASVYLEFAYKHVKTYLATKAELEKKAAENQG